MPDFKLRHTVYYKGERYAPGTVLSLPQKDADALLAHGAVEEVAPPPKAKSPKGGKGGKGGKKDEAEAADTSKGDGVVPLE
jgi:hypothetical protein